MRPEKSLIICTLPRSGSYLLCDGLSQTGRLGLAAEYYSEENDLFYERLLGPAKAKNYDIVFDTAMRIGMTDNGVFSVKILFHHLAEMKQRFTASGSYLDLSPIEIIDRLLPDPHYVHLVRRDKLRQAISYHRAIASGIWWRFDERQSRQEVTLPQYDHAAIRHWLRVMEQWEAAWPRLLQGLGRKVLTLYYDEVVDDYTGALRKVHDLLGIEPAPGLAAIQPELKKQSGATTEMWLTRFEAEEARLDTRAIA